MRRVFSYVLVLMVGSSVGACGSKGTAETVAEGLGGGAAGALEAPGAGAEEGEALEPEAEAEEGEPLEPEAGAEEGEAHESEAGAEEGEAHESEVAPFDPTTIKDVHALDEAALETLLVQFDAARAEQGAAWVAGHAEVAKARAAQGALKGDACQVTIKDAWPYFAGGPLVLPFLSDGAEEAFKWRTASSVQAKNGKLIFTLQATEGRLMDYVSASGGAFWGDARSGYLESSLWQLDCETPGALMERLFTDWQGDLGMGVFSPDGKQLAYRQKDRLMVLDVAKKKAAALKPALPHVPDLVAWGEDGLVVDSIEPEESCHEEGGIATTYVLAPYLMGARAGELAWQPVVSWAGVVKDEGGVWAAVSDEVQTKIWYAKGDGEAFEPAHFNVLPDEMTAEMLEEDPKADLLAASEYGLRVRALAAVGGAPGHLLVLPELPSYPRNEHWDVGDDAYYSTVNGTKTWRRHEGPDFSEICEHGCAIDRIVSMDGTVEHVRVRVAREPDPFGKKAGTEGDEIFAFETRDGGKTWEKIDAVIAPMPLERRVKLEGGELVFQPHVVLRVAEGVKTPILPRPEQGYYMSAGRWVSVGVLELDQADKTYAKGLEALGKGDAEGALAAFEEAYRINPNMSVARYKQAAVYGRQGETEKAMEVLEALWATGRDGARRLLKEAAGDADFRGLSAEARFQALVSVRQEALVPPVEDMYGDLINLFELDVPFEAVFPVASTPDGKLCAVLYMQEPADADDVGEGKTELFLFECAGLKQSSVKREVAGYDGEAFARDFELSWWSKVPDDSAEYEAFTAKVREGKEEGEPLPEFVLSRGPEGQLIGYVIGTPLTLVRAD